MKRKTIIGLIISCILFSISCKKNDEPIPILSFTEEEVVFENKGGEKDIVITTNQAKWTASFETMYKEQWITLSQTEKTLTIKALPNTLFQQRTTTVIIQAGTIRKSINIRQKEKLEIAYEVAIPSTESFLQAPIQQVVDEDKRIVAELCLEYIKSGAIAQQMKTIYSVREGTLNTLVGTTLPDGGSIEWQKEGNTCKYTKGTLSKTTTFYLLQDGSIVFTPPENKEIVRLQVQPYLLTDKRKEEENKYKIVKIGTQYWMAENLRTAYYRDETPIKSKLAKDEWLIDTQGAFTIYENKLENIATMGALYNWYAVIHPKGLAPSGYRVSKDEDWAIMAKYLDPDNYDKDSKYGARESETIAPLLKSTQGWKDAGNGNNLTGLSISPCGSTSESKYMDYSGKERQAYFWTTREYENKTALFRRIYYDEVFTNRWFENKTYGYSVRCLRI